MDRQAWIIAIRMVRKHGADAFQLVEEKLEKMQRDCAVRRTSSAEDRYRRWCWIARAVLEITRGRKDTEAVH